MPGGAAQALAAAARTPKVRADLTAAFHWYRLAAEGGDFRGKCNLGTLLARQQHWTEAADWLHSATQAGTREFLCAACHELLAQAEPRLRAIGRLALQRIATHADGNR